MPKYLSDLHEADLKEVKNLAALFFTPREIAMMLEIDPGQFVMGCDVEGTTVYNAFQGGRLQSEVDYRTSVVKLAKSGSSPAQTMVKEMIDKSKMRMLNR